MADIVRLEENGITQYVQTVPKAVIGLDELLKVADTDWVDVPFKNGVSGSFQVRKKGDVVYFAGVAYNINNIASGVVIATLPAQFRPIRMMPVIGMGATARTNAVYHMVYVGENGDLTLTTPPEARAQHMQLANIMYTIL